MLESLILFINTKFDENSSITNEQLLALIKRHIEHNHYDIDDDEEAFAEIDELRSNWEEHIQR